MRKFNALKREIYNVRFELISIAATSAAVGIYLYYSRRTLLDISKPGDFELLERGGILVYKVGRREIHVVMAK